MTASPAIDTRHDPDPETPRWAFVAWAGFVLLLFYVLVIGGSWLGLYILPVRVLDIVIIGVGLVAWAIAAWRRPAWRPTTAIWPAFVAPFVAFVLSISASAHPRLGFDYLSYAVLLVALYLLLVRIVALPYVRARIGGAVAAIAFIMLGAYIAMSLQIWVEWWGLVGGLQVPPLRPALLGMTWGSPSVVFTVLTLMVSVAIGGLGLSTRGARFTAAVLILMLAVAGFISGSRSGWLAISGAIVIVGGLALLDARGRALLAKAWSRRAFRLALIPLGIAAGAATLVLGPIILDRLGQGDAGRLEIWASALRMFEDAPLLGLGPGTWMVERVGYQAAGELNWYQPHAHSQYFQTAAEFGVVGLVAGAIAFASVAWLLYRAIAGDDPSRRRWAWTSVFGLTYLALNVFVDTHTIPAVALLLGLPIAVLDATSGRGIPLPLVPRRVACWLRDAAAVLLAVACLASMAHVLRSESTAMVHQEAVAAAGEGDWESALEPALAAAADDPGFGVYDMTAALALAADGDWPRAATAYEAVTEVDQLPDAWIGLARARVEMGEPAERVAEALAEGLRLGEQEPALTLAAAWIYDLAGLTEEADAAFVDTLTAVPTLAYDDAFRAAMGEVRFERLVDLAMEAAPAGAWELALMAGDEELALELAADGDDAVYQQAYVRAWDGDDAAYAQVVALTEETPTNGGRLSRSARLADHRGYLDDAARYRRLKRIGVFYGPGTVSVGLGQRRPLGDAATGSSTYYYGTYTYRRTLPLDLLPPGQPGLVLVTNVEDDADAVDGDLAEEATP